MSLHDDIVEALKRNGGTLADIADALSLSPDNRAWLASKRIAEPANERHGRALCDSRLMKDEFNLSRTVRLATISRRHYPGDNTLMPARIIASDVSAEVKHLADRHEAWIRADPDRLARHLKTLLPQKPQTNCGSP